MPKLPPRVGTIEEEKFLRFVPLQDIDFTFVGYLLACHLAIEHYLDEFLMSCAPDLAWDRTRLTFNQKTELFPHTIFPNGEEVIAGIRHLNGLRNKLAHRLETKPEDFDYLPFTRLMQKAKAPELPTEPMQILEQFTQTISWYFMGWLASDAHRTTWRQERQNTKTTRKK
jgi:hypothetical protein